ncbi:MAG: type II toxin-antitoxin system mRNA interferase toxin, RelE/StbE family [Deltaproteobacteria bacterium]|nr:type II toxin-antitoxin system mRNA interferase toxin, RelE/StbE family [Deltaproteobacteria bacterium]
MRREVVLTPKFKRAFRKFVRHNKKLQKQIEDTIEQMQEDIFSTTLNTHKLIGNLEGLRASICGYDCRIVFSLEHNSAIEVIILLDIGRHDEVY